MLNQKTADRHDEANAAAAAHVLRNRASQPVVMVAWAELCQRRLHRERVEDGQHGYPAPRRPAAGQPEQAATTAQRQQQLPLTGVSHATD